MSILDRLFQRDFLAALQACSRHFMAAALFSLGINVLYLAVPIYMLQVYDRVLGSGSVPTLIMLTLALLITLATLAALDYVRSRVLTRSGVRLENRLAARVMSALVERTNQAHGTERAQAIRDFDTFRQFVASGGVNALFDAPWAPIFIAAAFLVHLLLGAFALACAILLLGLAFANQYMTRQPLAAAMDSSLRNYEFTEASLRNTEVIQALGMLPGLIARWSEQRRDLIGAQASAADRGAAVASVIRFLRLFMQSLMLGIGAYLAIDRSITPGQMFAATILLARALQPIEQAVGMWRQLVTAYGASARIGRLLAQGRPPESIVSLPRPNGRVSVEQVTFMPPGAARPILLQIQFGVEPGQALAVIGPTAAGKSTLARLIVGVYRPNAGVVRLDGADVFTWARAEFGRYVGYLPQDIELFSGTVAENIARFGGDGSDSIVRAAQAADAHDMILRLPNGYDTTIGEGGAMLSPGQRQRIALARALYGDPALVVLDEPNSNLDAEGDNALSNALANVKNRGATLIIVTHRIAVLSAVDRILALHNGAMLAFGPPADVMTKLQRPTQTAPVVAPAGLSKSVRN